MAGETISKLGTDPHKEDPGLDAELDVLDLTSGLIVVMSQSWAVPKNDDMYLWKATRGLDWSLDVSATLERSALMALCETLRT